MVIDRMFYQKNALKRFVESIKLKCISMKSVNDLLKYKDSGLDVSILESYLNSDDEFVRKYVAKIIIVMGDVKKVFDIIKDEKNVNVLLFVLNQLLLSKNRLNDGYKKDFEDLIFLIDENSSGIVKDSAMQMFKGVGMVDCLIPLLFSDDDIIVNCVKRWIKDSDK